MTESDLLRGVLDNPDDMTRRLIYADWQEEYGDAERAAFIRLGIDLAYAQARFFKSDNLDERELLHKRLKKLQKQERHSCWNALLAKWGPQEPGCDFLWNRGFIDQVMCNCTRWIASADAILTAHPVRFVRITDDPVWREHWYDDHSGPLHERVWLLPAATPTYRIYDDLHLRPGENIPRALFRHRWQGIRFQFPGDRP